MRRITLIIVAIFALLVCLVRQSLATTTTQSGAGTQTVFDATTGGADVAGGCFIKIAVYVDSGSSAPVSFQVYDLSGNTMFVAGREATLPAGAGVEFTFSTNHPIAKVVAIFTASGTVYVCPSAK